LSLVAQKGLDGYFFVNFFSDGEKKIIFLQKWYIFFKNGRQYCVGLYMNINILKKRLWGRPVFCFESN